jgi:hypothetical protein
VSNPFFGLPFALPKGERIAVKVINHLEDEAIKVFGVC